jgi:hypothetical protein
LGQSSHSDFFLAVSTSEREMDSKVIIEMASAGAILLGLIFVGLELKQNTEAVESQTSQGLLELANQANNQIASD